MPEPMSSGQRTQVTCSKCSKTTTVPFVPTPGRPVYCRECFGAQPARDAAPRGSMARPQAGSAPGTRSAFAPQTRGHGTPRQRMMAQGRKGHFMYDARAAMGRSEGGMDDQFVRAFLEGLFARGARTSTKAAQEYLDEKQTEGIITPEQRESLGNLVERYSFWR